mmetsp:Transcript_269/g.400  ORF Transcript_269/g.400 Transcript_269/m.400 type:complete len:329 (+) Transcript_269:60-1046(+)|eukprot:CAMPEP_0118709050 /NCGR_PEP_ID=MMETSP0800-20121206/22350_1 /TAXON_ID=210618 ORGANISM="Striatella unipunctata, Strain CCMP2910" /NCGR_SAMPLE_ID=MMETSP0800 /ASSEMBLY_ACC=CAM_ASM_000638 /LENGTH=328 /DNA_ID=CAMNT_0006612557 /DNA_START=29 /DNA_END=1015 /DNA_ORIENTATION=-
MSNIYIDAVHDNPPTEFSDETQAACNEIKEAVDGWGSDEEALINILGSKTIEELYDIYYCYESMFGKSVQHVLKSEIGSGDFGLAMQLLSMPGDGCDAKIVREATKGMGAQERILYPILGARSNAEIAMVKEAYFRFYDEDMAVRLNDELGGDFEKFIFHCLQGLQEEYDEEIHNAEKAEEDADKFFESTQGDWWGTDEKAVFQIICDAPTEHMINIDKVYQAKYEKTLEEVLDTELGGELEKAARFALGFKVDPARQVAKLIKLSARGLGTDELLLTCTIIRYRKFLKDAQEKYQELYGQTLSEVVSEEVGGKFQTLLLKVVEKYTE